MTRRYHVIAGLPRSGSTLLAALLSQNPRLLAHSTGPLYSAFNTVHDTLSGGNEAAAFLDDEVRSRVLAGLFDSFYADRGEEVVFDTNRAWPRHLAGLTRLFPGLKAVCCVRSLSWIVDSFERLVQANALENTRLFGNWAQRDTVATRASTLAGPGGVIGNAFDILKEAYYGPNADRLLLVEYEDLAREPIATLRRVYDFLGEPWFEHDPARVAYDAPAFDDRLGVQGLHRVEGPVELRERASVLPPDVFARYQGNEFWRDEHGA